MDITKDELKELIQAEVSITKPKEEAVSELTLAKLIEGLPAESKELQLAELRKIYWAQFESELAHQKFEVDMAELSGKLVGGSEDAPRGYSVKADELKAHLVKMTPEDAKFWTDLLAKTAKDGLVEFAEVGHGKVIKGAPLPEWAKPMLAEFIKGGGTQEQFFALNPETGNQADYDLAEFVKKE